MPAFVDTVLNVAHVDDLAAGQLLVLEKGQTGRSYILGGENLTLEQLLAELAAASRDSARPHGSKVPNSRGSLGRGGRRPRACRVADSCVAIHRALLEAARMSTSRMSLRHDPGPRGTGYAPRPASEAPRGFGPPVRRETGIGQARAGLSRIRWSTTPTGHPPER